MSVIENAQEFDAVKECWKLSQKFVDYIMAMPDLFYLVSGVSGDPDPEMDRFYSNATSEQEEELVRLSVIVNECTKHVSNLQCRMIDLGLVGE